MLSKTICLVIAFLAATTVGTIGNFFLLTSYMLYVLAGHKMSSLMHIFMQLPLVNSTMLVTKGIPQILQGLGWNYFLDDAGCKVIFYLCRVSESLSITLTSLLCTLQAITISPNNSRWSEFKVRATQQTIRDFYLICWILNLLIEVAVPVNIRGPTRSSNVTNIYYITFCTLEQSTGAYLIIASFRNGLCLGLMVLASGYMVFLLHKHHQNMHKIQNTNLSTGRHREVRATQTILLLMSTFVSFYALTSIFTLYINYFNPKTPPMLPTAIFLSLCYPTISPFVLILRTLRNPSKGWVKKISLFSCCSKL